MEASDFRAIQRALNHPEPAFNKYGLPYWKGSLGNLSVWLSEEYGLTVKGSLCKYHFGNNFHTLRLPETSTALEKLEDHLEISIKEMRVTRIDFAENLVLDYPVENYLSRLSTSKYYPNRKEHRKRWKLQTVSWENTLRCKKAYNKIDEAIFTKTPLPIEFADKHLLRFETACLKSLQSRFNRHTISVKTLTEQEFYLQMLDYWKYEYDSIYKIHLPMASKNVVKRPSDKLKQFAALYIEEIGLEAALQSVEDDKALGRMKSKHAYSNAKAQIKSISKKFSDTSDIVEELNSKVRSIEP